MKEIDRCTCDCITAGNKRITELEQLKKLSGLELMLIDDGVTAKKVSVDTLLGYIAKEINSGTISEDLFSSCNIIEIPVGEDIPVVSRIDGNYYLRTCEVKDAQIAAGMDTTIVVGPNMALKLVED